MQAMEAPHNVDVVIVGCGPAGIAAAKTLLSQQPHKSLSIAILEARDRIGGRCRTIYLPPRGSSSTNNQLQQLQQQSPIAIDMGASFAHTTSVQSATAATSFMQWAKDSNIDLKLVLFDENNVTFDCETAELLNEDVVKLADDAFTAIITAFEAKREALDKNNDCSVYEAVQDLCTSDATVKEALQKLEAKSSANFVKRVKYGWLRSFSGMLGLEAAKSSLRWASCEEANQFSEGENDEDFVVGLGYQRALELMAKDLPIYLNHIVTCIEKVVNEASKATSMLVHVKDKTLPIQCKHVICTLPLGVLKHGDVQFKPPLPHYKQQAIEQISNGLLNKILLQFDKAFWPSTSEAISFIPSEQDDEISAYCINMQRIANEPILLFLTEGKFAEEVESKDDETIKQRIMSMLKRLFGEQTVNETPLVHFEVTRWMSEPFSRGAYSAVSVNTPFMNVFDDITRVDGRLYFAGEHTILKNGGFVQGAIDSGVRAALQLLGNDDS